MFEILDKWPHKLAHTSIKMSEYQSIMIMIYYVYIHQNHGLRFVNLATSCRAQGARGCSVYSQGAELSWKTSSWCQCHKLSWKMQTDRRKFIAIWWIWINACLLLVPSHVPVYEALVPFDLCFLWSCWSSCDNCDSVRLCWFLLPFESWLQCSAGRYDITPLFGAGLILLFYLNMIAVRDLGGVVRFKCFFATYALDIG